MEIINFLLFFRPDLPRPIKVNVLIPIIFLIVCFCLVLIPSYYEPNNLLINLLIILSGVPFYYTCVSWKKKPKLLSRVAKCLEKSSQIVFSSIFIDDSSER